MGITEFIDTYKDAIARMVTQAYRPLYQPSEHSQQREPMPRLLRSPLGAQEHALRGTAMSLKANIGTLVVGEMGVGKTYIGIAAALMAGLQNILVICPPHLVQKWKREIEMTVPCVQPRIVHRITDLKMIHKQGFPEPGKPPNFTIMSRETAKLGYRWQPAFVMIENAICCPDCFQRVLDKDGIPVSYSHLNRKRLKCELCQGALWQPRAGGAPEELPLPRLHRAARQARPAQVPEIRPWRTTSRST